MTCFASILGFLFAAISLEGVDGRDIQVQAAFDAYNVRVGDPMKLTIDFYGSADFTSIHPPALSGEVDSKVWKIDDASAKTETYRNARRLVYRVRPLAVGVVRFPPLEFEYENENKEKFTTDPTPEIPVHVREGQKVALAELDGLKSDLPKPDGIIIDLAKSPWNSAEGLSDDALFAWRRACSNPKAEAFAAFDFPEARLNEAACDIMESNWAKAMKIYSRLEWKIGQTAEIENGIVAALSLKEGMSVELPMWRNILRPVLKYPWMERVLIFVGILIGAAALLLVLRIIVRALACVVLAAALAGEVAAANVDPMTEQLRRMDEMQRQMEERMNAVFGGGGIFGPLGGNRFSMTINGQPAPEVNIVATATPDKTDLKVGENFNWIVRLEMPKTVTVQLTHFTPNQKVGYSMTGNGIQLADEKSENPTNIIRSISIPARYDAPFEGDVSCDIGGQYTARIVQSDGGMSFSSMFSQQFAETSSPVKMRVKPLSDENRPADFSGAVGKTFRIIQQPETTTVATNDVVAITCFLDFDGYVPAGTVPGGTREKPNRIAFRKFFVADGSPRTEDISFSYYNVDKKDYDRVVSRGMILRYVPAEKETESELVVNAQDAAQEQGRMKIFFSPRESAPETGTVNPALITVTETSGAWSRVSDGRHAGWVKTARLPKKESK